jgi:hypothetical protein
MTVTSAGSAPVSDVLADLGSGAGGPAGAEAQRRLRRSGPNAVRTYRVSAWACAGAAVALGLLLAAAVMSPAHRRVGHRGDPGGVPGAQLRQPATGRPARAHRAAGVRGGSGRRRGAVHRQARNAARRSDHAARVARAGRAARSGALLPRPSRHRGDKRVRRRRRGRRPGGPRAVGGGRGPARGGTAGWRCCRSATTAAAPAHSSADRTAGSSCARGTGGGTGALCRGTPAGCGHARRATGGRHPGLRGSGPGGGLRADRRPTVHNRRSLRRPGDRRGRGRRRRAAAEWRCSSSVPTPAHPGAAGRDPCSPWWCSPGCRSPPRCRTRRWPGPLGYTGEPPGSPRRRGWPGPPTPPAEDDGPGRRVDRPWSPAGVCPSVNG